MNLSIVADLGMTVLSTLLLINPFIGDVTVLAIGDIRETFEVNHSQTISATPVEAS